MISMIGRLLMPPVNRDYLETILLEENLDTYIEPFLNEMDRIPYVVRPRLNSRKAVISAYLEYVHNLKEFPE